MVQLGLGDKRLQQFIVFFLVIGSVEIEQVVDTESMGGDDEAVHRDIRLQGARGADADDGQCAEMRFDGAGDEIDIGQGVEFIEDDVDIVRADTGGDDGKAHPANIARVGNEFAVAVGHFHLIEVPANGRDAIGVADGNNGGCKFFREGIEVVHGATGVDNQF